MATWRWTTSSAYDIVREHHALTLARMNRRNSALSEALRPVPKFAVGGSAGAYNTAATVPQGAKSDTDAKVLKAKVALNRTSPYKSLRSWSLLLSGCPGRISPRG